MPIKLTKPIVVLSEGLADKNFLSKLIVSRLPESECDFPYPTADIGGVTSFEKMLRGLRASAGFNDVRGVLIVADSANDPQSVLKIIRSQIESAEGYPIPDSLSEIAAKTESHPATCVLLLPTDKDAGGLETLCNSALRDIYPGAESCVEQFLACGDDPPITWPPEKLAKARYHAYVASCYKTDPSRALSYAFKEPNPEIPQALLSITSRQFDDLSERLRVAIDGLINS